MESLSIRCHAGLDDYGPRQVFSDVSTLDHFSFFSVMILETERLVLRMWEARDFEVYASMSADAKVMQFLGPRRPLSRFESWNSFSSLVGHWKLRGFGMFAVTERATGELVGRVGPWQPEDWPDFEIGWVLRSLYWGRGYATEAVKACIRYAFTELDRPHLISIIDPENVNSIRVAERVGERFEGNVVLPIQPERTHLQYGLNREDWKMQGAKTGGCRLR